MKTKFKNLIAIGFTALLFPSWIFGYDMIPSGKQETPARRLERSEVVTAIEQALQKLPARQRQAFLLRYWEELDVAQTAAAMGCSQGSVKTHCSRATRSIAAYLKNRGLEP